MINHIHALPNGYHLHEYRITEVLGFGGFGITYSAMDTNLEKVVAIKEFLPSDLAVRVDGITVSAKSEQDKDGFEWGLRRFLSEARIVAKFDHPNIVKIYRFFEQNGTGYIVMEFIEGKTLITELKDKGILEEHNIRAWLWPIMNGLKIVHQTGYLHRDIKPHNIMMRDDGRPCLLDFGAARMAIGNRTQSLTAIMTPGYAPLEQYQTKGNQGAWTDIYALGAVMYRCIAGRKPRDALDRIRNDVLAAPDTFSGKVYSKGLVNGIMSALSMHESHRPQNIDALLRVLDSEEDVTRKLPVTSKPVMVVSALQPAFDDQKSQSIEHEEEQLQEEQPQKEGFQREPPQREEPLQEKHQIKKLQPGEPRVKDSQPVEQHELASSLECFPEREQLDVGAERQNDFKTKRMPLPSKPGKANNSRDITELKPSEPTLLGGVFTKLKAEKFNINRKRSLFVLAPVLFIAFGVYWWMIDQQESAIGQSPNNVTHEGSQSDIENKNSLASIEIRSNPVGADVFLNGEFVGVTPTSLDGVEKGKTLIFRVEHAGYLPIWRDVRVTGEAVQTELFSLNKDIQGYSFTIKTEPAGSTVRVLNITARYEDGMLLEPGRYHVEVSNSGYETKREWVEIKDRDITEVFRLVEKNESPEQIQKVAERGDPYSQFILGEMYDRGNGVPQNFDMALAWYMKAAEQNYPDAQVKIGSYFQSGEKALARDVEKAVEWYRKAADQDDQNGQYALGLMYNLGLGVEQSQSEAINWYRKSAIQGNKQAISKLDRLGVAVTD